MCNFLRPAYRHKFWKNPETGGGQKPNFLKKGTTEEDFKRMFSTVLDQYEFLMIPCGNCIECRLAKSREWADRCMLEARSYKNNYFITLTYDNEHLPKTKKAIDIETGEIIEWETLKPTDMQKFFKDLTRYYEYHYEHIGIKKYYCGEYGDQHGRPHYHTIVFNLPLFDLKYICSSQSGEPQYVSDILTKIWGKGIVRVGTVTWESCAYTARYVMKKQNGEKHGQVKFKDEHNRPFYIGGIEQEFTRMSRRPGIGKLYYENNKDTIYRNDEMFIKNKNGLSKAKPPRYFDKLYDIENPEELKHIKERRKEIAIRGMKNQLRGTDLSEEEYRQMKYENKLIQISKLKRRYEREGV